MTDTACAASASAAGGETVTLRSLVPSVFLPTVVYDIGNGAIAPILALAALKLGATPALAGAVVGLLGIGQLLGNAPAAAVVNRIGDRRAMIASALLAGAAMVTASFATHVLVLAAATLVIGAGNATFGLARHAFVTLVAPPSIRAAIMSTVGGSHRVGLFIGPFAGAAVIDATSLRAAFLVGVGTAIATAVLLTFVAEPPGAEAFSNRPKETASAASVWRAHGRLLATLGSAVFAIGAVRAARATVLPLWADHIGLDPRATSIIFGIGMAVDMALFYPAGKVMDRLGRLAVALPSMGLLGGAMMLIPLTGSATGLALVGIIMAAGNGLGSGIIMTLGADVAPRDTPIRFLSQWRFMSDSGNTAGPLLVAAIATFSLASGIIAAGLLGWLAAAAVARWAPRYSPYATREMVRANGETH